ncbi:MAG: hypothetical protein MZV70_50735 [Desulfobacterales bacterium]|nr:hypothetical protein [Desulfobacterales bacterium]
MAWTSAPGSPGLMRARPEAALADRGRPHQLRPGSVTSTSPRATWSIWKQDRSITADTVRYSAADQDGLCRGPRRPDRRQRYPHGVLS